MDIQKLTTIFNERLFRIPDYQRGYAWGTHELQDFWADLVRATSVNRFHFCNQLMLEAVAKETWLRWDADEIDLIKVGFEPLSVVDGQQRLTTSLILIQVLLDGLAADQQFGGASVLEQRTKFLVKTRGTLRHALFGYADKGPAHQFFLTQILSINSSRYQGERTLYTANLENASSFFRERVAGASNADREAWFNTLTKRFLFNLSLLPKEVDKFIAFETMNYRGKDLSCLELLKNRLIYLATLIPSASDAERTKLREDIGAVWNTIYVVLGRDASNPLPDDEFLRAHRVVYFAEVENEGLDIFLLEKQFTVERLDAGQITGESIAAYTQSLAVSVACWHRLRIPERYSNEMPAEEIAAIERLKRLDWGMFHPLLLASLMHVTALQPRMDIYRQAERFLFLVRGCTNTRSHVARADAHRWAHQLFIRPEASPEVSGFFRQRVEWYFSAERFQNLVDDYFRADDAKGYYWLGVLRFWLFEYEENIRREYRAPSAKITWDGFHGAPDSLEHIYPQGATDEDWPAFAACGPLERRHLMNSLGNFLALSQSKNSSLQRRPYQEKRAGWPGRNGYAEGSFSENKLAVKYRQWTAEEIRDRGLELLEFMEQQWEVSLGDRATKLKLLKADVWAPPISPQ